MVVAITVVTLEAIEVAVVVTTVCTPPMSLAIRDCTSPVRVRVKNASESRCRCAVDGGPQVVHHLLADLVRLPRLGDADGAGHDRDRDHPADQHQRAASSRLVALGQHVVEQVAQQERRDHARARRRPRSCRADRPSAQSVGPEQAERSGVVLRRRSGDRLHRAGGGCRAARAGRSGESSCDRLRAERTSRSSMPSARAARRPSVDHQHAASGGRRRGLARRRGRAPRAGRRCRSRWTGRSSSLPASARIGSGRSGSSSRSTWACMGESSNSAATLRHASRAGTRTGASSRPHGLGCRHVLMRIIIVHSLRIFDNLKYRLPLFQPWLRICSSRWKTPSSSRI